METWIKEFKEDLYLPVSKLDFANQILRRFNRVLVKHIYSSGSKAPASYHIEKWSDYVERTKNVPTFDVNITAS